MKKTMKRHSFITRLASLAVMCGLTLAFASCANDDLAQNGKTSTDDKGLTAFCTGEPATRTTMEADGKFYWEAGDKIWVKDDSGNWKQSSNSPTGKTASFKFLMPGKYTAKSSYEVYYPGKNGNQDKVTISNKQKQTEPNTTAHFGASGDCGIAKATRNATSHEFEFTLDHKAAYLVFKPYTSNGVLKYCYLTKIEVTSDNDITDTYTLDPTAATGTGALTGTGNGKQIVLTTKGNYGSTYCGMRRINFGKVMSGGRQIKTNLYCMVKQIQTLLKITQTHGSTMRVVGRLLSMLLIHVLLFLT